MDDATSILAMCQSFPYTQQHIDHTRHGTHSRESVYDVDVVIKRVAYHSPQIARNVMEGRRYCIQTAFIVYCV